MRIYTKQIKTCGDCPHYHPLQGTWICGKLDDMPSVELYVDIEPPPYCPLPIAPAPVVVEDREED